MDDATEDWCAPQADDTARAIEREVLALHESHPDVPLRDVFDLVMTGRRGRVIEFGEILDVATGDGFLGLVMDTFAPWSEAEQRALEGSEVDFDMLEFRPFEAQSRFEVAYELNGYQGRAAWSEAFADRLLRYHPSIDRAAALDFGGRKWDEGRWQTQAWAVADWLCGRNADR